MFGLIGAQPDGDSIITPSNIVQSFAVIIIGIVLRTVAAWLSVISARLTQYKHMYVAISWLPKATVQAALVLLFFATAMKMADPSDELIQVGNAVGYCNCYCNWLTVVIYAILEHRNSVHLDISTTWCCINVMDSTDFTH